MNRALCASTALATGLLMAGGAFAQSSGTAVVEELVITGARGPLNQGGIVAVEAPKSRSTITQEFISRQQPGATVLETINLLPAVNFTNNDPYGSAGGDITLRGFDSQRVALLEDGMPLNDTGNYALYSNQQLDPELIARVDVNQGTTDVDSPTAAAAGGTINYISKVPSDVMGMRAEIGGGSDNFQRYYGTFETGKFGPWGTKAWLSATYTRNDLFRPKNSPIDAPGKIEKKQFNARIYQDLGDNGDFVSLIAHYNVNRNNFIRRISLTQYNMQGVTAANRPDTAWVYDATCTRPTPAAGTAQNEATTASGFTAACGNYYNNNINPSNTGNIRGQSRFHLLDNLILTVDPSFQYTLANGGGRTIMPESDLQLRTATDLNGDGDALDRVLLYWPNTSNTRRYLVTSSLIWNVAKDHTFRLAYTYDKGRHRQTGDAGYFDQSGNPENVFGGKNGYGEKVLLSDGTSFRRRDRYSVAELNQYSAEYQSRWLEDKLLVNVGVRLPYFHRELNNYCYQRDTFNAFCTTQTPFTVTGTNDGAGVPFVVFPTSANAPAGSGVLTAAQLAAFRAVYGATANPSVYFGQPRSFERNYHRALPSAGVRYDVTDQMSVYASYAEVLSAPRTDDLYDRNAVSPKAELNHAYDIGWRYQTPTLMATLTAFYNKFENRIERQFDENAQIFFSVNVGEVQLKGFNGEIGWQPTDALNLYGSLSYVDSEIKNDFPNGAGGAILATKGKELYETPKWQGATRLTYSVTDNVSVGVQGKYVGERWSNLTNTEKAPSYTLWDLDARYMVTAFGLKNTYLQLNIKNLFDERYLGDITTNTNGNGQFQPGYRRTFIVTLHAEI
ncbi:TonB-dependent receptor [Phenylobacterium sp. LjRoot225]|uniref:TonB-dependent receptor n=1 Tax=Phenylobacterium sp. LjRoot225 TaxID=3342285 RepID=UPI003ECC659D